MKNYDGSPNLKNNPQVAKTTWLELEQAAHAVVETLERENPNYLILNEAVTGSTSYYDNQTLNNADVMHVGYDPNHEQAFILYSGSALRLHRGLMSKQTSTYVFFGGRSEWMLIGGTIENHAIGTHPKVDQLCTSLSISPTDVWIIDLSKTYEAQNRLVSTTDSGILEVDFTLQPAATPTLNSVDSTFLMQLPAGYVIICNTLEEGEPISRYSKTRLLSASYLIHPRGISAGYWVPQLYDISDSDWSWQYQSKANERGTSTWFVFNAPYTRFVPTYDAAGKPSTDSDHEFTTNITFYSWAVGTASKPKWAFQGLNTVPWFSQNLLYRTYTNIRDFEEEIFVDDSFERGTTVFDGYTDPSYTVNIKSKPTVGTYVRFF